MKKIFSILLCIGLVAGFVACEKDKEFELTKLSVENETITPSYESADVSCRLKADATISEAYVHYSLSSSFAKYEVAKMSEEKGVYVAQLTSLQDNTIYYIRYSVSNKYSSVVTTEVKAFTTKDKPRIELPSVSTAEITQITINSAVAGGNVISDGNASVTERGVCVATSSNPTTSNTKITVGSGTGEFTCNLTGLQEGTKYYVRAYAVNSKGTAYGEEVVFTTTVAGVPTITTTQPSQVTETTAVSGGNVTSDGNASVTERGVCISTVSNPTTANTKITAGSGTGSFTCNLTGLQANTTYYVRAYAINSKGTAYGEQVSFTTNKTVELPSVTTSVITQITQTTAVAGGSVTADGNASVTERGVVYSTVSNPVINNIYHTTITSGSGTGSFSVNLTNLVEGTTYYVRAYAVNSAGVSYGEEVSFMTNGTENSHEYVDLGLSVKWATCNVGANAPEEYGDYFAWGETEPKDYYDWSTYKWCNGSNNTFTKYNYKDGYGTLDNKMVLDKEDDAAAVNWGGAWRMPTKAEQDELRSNCTWTWTTQNGVNGYKVTSNKNGNSIFFPAAGYHIYGAFNQAGSGGSFWSSSLITILPYNAYALYFCSDYVERSADTRYYGMSVRPVCQ